jgi:hypothetical protein
VLCARNLNSRVLVVEEHPALRDRLAGSLTAAGFVATATGDGLWAPKGSDQPHPILPWSILAVGSCEPRGQMPIVAPGLTLS